MHLNIEIKARCSNQDSIRNLLLERGADFRGTDHQIDTYFNVLFCKSVQIAGYRLISTKLTYCKKLPGYKAKQTTSYHRITPTSNGETMPTTSGVP